MYGAASALRPPSAGPYSLRTRPSSASARFASGAISGVMNNSSSSSSVASAPAGAATTARGASVPVQQQKQHEPPPPPPASSYYNHAGASSPPLPRASASRPPTSLGTFSAVGSNSRPASGVGAVRSKRELDEAMATVVSDAMRNAPPGDELAYIAAKLLEQQQQQRHREQQSSPPPRGDPLPTVVADDADEDDGIDDEKLFRGGGHVSSPHGHSATVPSNASVNGGSSNSSVDARVLVRSWKEMNRRRRADELVQAWERAMQRPQGSAARMCSEMYNALVSVFLEAEPRSGRPDAFVLDTGFAERSLSSALIYYASSNSTSTSSSSSSNAALQPHDFAIVLQALTDSFVKVVRDVNCDSCEIAVEIVEWRIFLGKLSVDITQRAAGLAMQRQSAAEQRRREAEADAREKQAQQAPFSSSARGSQRADDAPEQQRATKEKTLRTIGEIHSTLQHLHAELRVEEEEHRKAREQRLLRQQQLEQQQQQQQQQQQTSFAPTVVEQDVGSSRLGHEAHGKNRSSHTLAPSSVPSSSGEYVYVVGSGEQRLHADAPPSAPAPPPQRRHDEGGESSGSSQQSLSVSRDPLRDDDDAERDARRNDSPVAVPHPHVQESQQQQEAITVSTPLPLPLQQRYPSGVVGTSSALSVLTTSDANGRSAASVLFVDQRGNSSSSLQAAASHSVSDSPPNPSAAAKESTTPVQQLPPVARRSPVRGGGALTPNRGIVVVVAAPAVAPVPLSGIAKKQPQITSLSREVSNMSNEEEDDAPIVIAPAGAPATTTTMSGGSSPANPASGVSLAPSSQHASGTFASMMPCMSLAMDSSATRSMALHDDQLRPNFDDDSDSSSDGGGGGGIVHLLSGCDGARRSSAAAARRESIPIPGAATTLRYALGAGGSSGDVNNMTLTSGWNTQVNSMSASLNTGAGAPLRSSGNNSGEPTLGTNELGGLVGGSALQKMVQQQQQQQQQAMLMFPAQRHDSIHSFEGATVSSNDQSPTSATTGSYHPQESWVHREIFQDGGGGASTMVSPNSGAASSSASVVARAATVAGRAPPRSRRPNALDDDDEDEPIVVAGIHPRQPKAVAAAASGARKHSVQLDLTASRSSGAAPPSGLSSTRRGPLSVVASPASPTCTNPHHPSNSDDGFPAAPLSPTGLPGGNSSVTTAVPQQGSSASGTASGDTFMPAVSWTNSSSNNLVTVPSTKRPSVDSRFGIVDSSFGSAALFGTSSTLPPTGQNSTASSSGALPVSAQSVQTLTPLGSQQKQSVTLGSANSLLGTQHSSPLLPNSAGHTVAFTNSSSAFGSTHNSMHANATSASGHQQHPSFRGIESFHSEPPPMVNDTFAGAASGCDFERSGGLPPPSEAVLAAAAISNRPTPPLPSAAPASSSSSTPKANSANNKNGGRADNSNQQPAPPTTSNSSNMAVANSSFFASVAGAAAASAPATKPSLAEQAEALHRVDVDKYERKSRHRIEQSYISGRKSVLWVDLEGRHRRRIEQLEAQVFSHMSFDFLGELELVHSEMDSHSSESMSEHAARRASSSSKQRRSSTPMAETLIPEGDSIFALAARFAQQQQQRQQIGPSSSFGGGAGGIGDNNNSSSNNVDEHAAAAAAAEGAACRSAEECQLHINDLLEEEVLQRRRIERDELGARRQELPSSVPIPVGAAAAARRRSSVTVTPGTRSPPTKSTSPPSRSPPPEMVVVVHVDDLRATPEQQQQQRRGSPGVPPARENSNLIHRAAGEHHDGAADVLVLVDATPAPAVPAQPTSPPQQQQQRLASPVMAQPPLAPAAPSRPSSAAATGRKLSRPSSASGVRPASPFGSGVGGRCGDADEALRAAMVEMEGDELSDRAVAMQDEALQRAALEAAAAERLAASLAVALFPPQPNQQQQQQQQQQSDVTSPAARPQQEVAAAASPSPAPVPHPLQQQHSAEATLPSLGAAKSTSSFIVWGGEQQPASLPRAVADDEEELDDPAHDRDDSIQISPLSRRSESHGPQQQQPMEQELSADAQQQQRGRAATPNLAASSSCSLNERSMMQQSSSVILPPRELALNEDGDDDADGGLSSARARRKAELLERQKQQARLKQQKADEGGASFWSRLFGCGCGSDDVAAQPAKSGERQAQLLAAEEQQQQHNPLRFRPVAPPSESTSTVSVAPRRRPSAQAANS